MPDLAQPLASAAPQLQADAARGAAFRDMATYVMMAGGAGMAGRGLLGLYNLVHRNVTPTRHTGPGPVVLDVPVPMGQKQADLPTTSTGHAWFLPATTLGGMAAFKGGWSLVDHLLNERRRSQLNTELQGAKDEYSQSLLGEFDQHKRKTAAEKDELAEGLNRLYDQFVKLADGAWYNPLNYLSADTKGKALGLYGTYAGLSGLMAGTAAYQSARKSSRRQVLQNALMKRRRRLYSERPSEVFARPVNSLAPLSEQELAPTSNDETALDAVS